MHTLLQSYPYLLLLLVPVIHYLYYKLKVVLKVLISNHDLVARHTDTIQRVLKLSQIDKLSNSEDMVIAIKHTHLEHLIKLILNNATKAKMSHSDVVHILNVYTRTKTIRWHAVPSGIQLQTRQGAIDFIWAS